MLNPQEWVRPCSDMIKTKAEDRPWQMSSIMGQMEEETLKKVTKTYQGNRKREQGVFGVREAKEIVSKRVNDYVRCSLDVL